MSEYLSEYLSDIIQKNRYSQAQFSYALKNNNITALTIQVNKAQRGSQLWLSSNKVLAKSQSTAAFKLGNWYWHLANKSPKQAAIITAELWFKQAIRLGSEQAIVTLAQLYFNQGEPSQAKALLKQFTSNPAANNLAMTALILRIKIAIYLGDSTLVNKLVASTQFQLAQGKEAKDLLTDIYQFGILVNDDNTDYARTAGDISDQDRTPATCITSLQLFATNLTHLKHLEQLINHFKTQQALAQFVCLPKPNYISRMQLDCTSDIKQAISCDEARWQKIADKVSTRHIGLMLAEGRANVHLGILYFDAKDSVDVFSHEVSHLVGFVDEYPLVKGHDKCQTVQGKPFAHNIVVLGKFYQGEQEKLRKQLLKKVPWADLIKTSTPILQASLDNSGKHQGWRLGTPVEFNEQIGLYPAETCQLATAQQPQSVKRSTDVYSAFKPLNRRTKLRYFASDFPTEYIAMLKAKPSQYLMPSFHYNIALALYQQGKLVRAKHWLRQAGRWEASRLRKARILKGGF